MNKEYISGYYKRLIDADALKKLLIDTLESIKKNPKMDGQEMHIIAACGMLGEMIDDAPTVFPVRTDGEDILPRCSECRHFVKNGFR